MSVPANATHIVRGYGLHGELLLETWHIGDSSKDMEVAAWRRLMTKGECSRIEIADCKTFRTETIP